MRYKIDGFKDGVRLSAVKCEIFARYFEDSEVNGREDNWEHPAMPCVAEVDNWNEKPQKAWCPVIDLETGRITNWQKGVTAKIHYKSCDENRLTFYDEDGNVFATYFDYVPDLLDPYNEGYGDYVIMTIDEDGFIDKFKPSIEDIADQLNFE